MRLLNVGLILIELSKLILMTLPLSAFAYPDFDDSYEADKLQSRIDATEIVALMGKDIREPFIQNWLRNTIRTPLIHSYDNGDAVYYIYHSDGISLCFTKGTLSGVFLYAEGQDEYRQFSGEIPYRLSFTMRKDEIDKLFGKPTKERGWSVYKTKYFSVTYEKNAKNPRPNIITFF